ncbi:MAG TPA: MFS transporter [Acidimicrobiia bacterium]|nr:MFS transporter [Acidimicrobiia bacterium]
MKTRLGDQLDVHTARRNAWLAWLGAGVALTGVQMIAPSLPVMQESLGLTENDLALVMSVYLLPATLASIPIGMVADRVGRRIVFGSSLLLFGVCGVLLATTSDFTQFLVIRFVQGLAFAGLLPLTMTILGDSFNGPELVGALGGRSVAISIADTVPPVIGGFLASMDWFWPWLGQAAAIPLGVVVLIYLEDPPSLGPTSSRHAPKVKALLSLFRRAPIVALQYSGFLRMFLKFCILTFLPLFLVTTRSLSPTFAGLAVGAASLTGAVLAALSGRLARLGHPTWWVMGGSIAMGASLIGMVVMPWSGAILGAALVYGAGDGAMGVFVNSFVAAATDTEQRASFVSWTGAIRNFGKFIAPVAFAGLMMVQSIYGSFIIAGVAALGSALLFRLLKPLEGNLARRGQPVET